MAQMLLLFREKFNDGYEKAIEYIIETQHNVKRQNMEIEEIMPISFMVMPFFL